MKLKGTVPERGLSLFAGSPRIRGAVPSGTAPAGVVIDRRYMDHDMGAWHVESPARIEELIRLLEDDPPVPYLAIAPRPATVEEIGWIHEAAYVDLIRSTAGK